VHYISLQNRTPAAFVDVIHKKLISAGRTIPSQSIRQSLFATRALPRTDPVISHIRVVSSEGQSISGATVIAIADNNTTKRSATDLTGCATLTIPTRRLFHLLIAHADYPGAVVNSWDPKEDIAVTLQNAENVGSVICTGTGHIPGLEGRLNPILDKHNRTYLHADNVAIDGSKQQPATFAVNTPLELEDSNGVIMQVCILHIQGDTSLLQFIKPRYDNR
jgi:hypothetical protein